MSRTFMINIRLQLYSSMHSVIVIVNMLYKYDIHRITDVLKVETEIITGGAVIQMIISVKNFKNVRYLYRPLA